MKISVLMSIYFKENPEFLEEALESVLKQTYMPEELLIVKDGPLTKELDDIIDRYKNKYPNLFTIIALEKNQGLGIALCEGVKLCRNNIIARMDSDDICQNDRFEKQIKYLLNNKNTDIIGSYIREFEGNVENIISSRKVPVSEVEIKEYVKKRNPFNHMTVMFKKESVIKAGNYKDFKWNEDYYLWARMINNGCIGHNIPEYLVYARTGDAMFERRGGAEYAKIELELQKEYLNMGIINRKEYCKNIICRTTARLVPNNIRRIIYLKFLRS